MLLIFLANYGIINAEHQYVWLYYKNTKFYFGVIYIKEKLKTVLEALKTKDGRKKFYKDHKQLILYFVFGVGTTVVSMVTYYICRVFLPNKESVPGWLQWIYSITGTFGIESNTALPVIISWFLSVTFAFVTNRIYVFGSGANTFGRRVTEMLRFYASRIFTLFVDLLIMFLLVDLTGINNFIYEFCAKVFSNVVVLVLNFILSKFFVFRKKKTGGKSGA